MKRISSLEKKYALEALNNQFSTSRNSIFITKLEKAFAAKFRVKYAISFSNGTATLHTALAALGVGHGDEVVVPPLTMSSTALAVLQNGSVPVFADVDMATFNLDPKAVEKCITRKTKAIMPVSLYGLPADYDGLLEICRKHNLSLIEDNAECFLGKYKSRYAGEYGHFASFSFQASKHLTCGEGGMLVTNNEELADKARRFSSLGYGTVSAKKGKISKDDIQDPIFNRHVCLGFNYRMSELSAAVTLGQVERIDELVQRRLEVAKLFDKAIAGTDLLIRQAEPKGYTNSYWAYSLILNTDKPETDWYHFRKLWQKNGGDGYYAAWKLSYAEAYFQNEVQKMPGVWQKYQKGLCPNAEYLQPRMIQLKTNYWNIKEAREQAGVLYQTVKDFSKTR